MKQRRTKRLSTSTTIAILSLLGAAACGGDDGTGSDTTGLGEVTGGAVEGPTSGGRTSGGPPAVGGEGEGGATAGGDDAGGSGGMASGGRPSGGAVAGGSPSGGVPAGGSPAGGAPPGGAPSGGVAAGGSPAGGSPSGGASAGGSPGGGWPSGGAGGLDCEEVDCLRAFACVAECGDEPFDNGCCPCPEGTFDVVGCGSGGASAGGVGPGGAGAGGASTGGVGPGGAGAGGASTGGVGGLPASCDTGCTPARECDEDGIVWECGGDYDYQAMVDVGCVDLATGVQRFCCPTTAFAHCLPRIVIDRDAYAREESVEPRWENPTAESIFLPGCGTVELEQQSGAAWEHLGPLVFCVWEGVAVKVAAGESFVDPMTVINEAGTFRFTGAYSVGCTPGEALSQAGCARGPIPVVSRAFVVE